MCMRQKIFTLLFAVVAITSSLFAKNGTCGKNLTWDLTDGVLTISGFGDMTNYDNDDKHRSPWFSERQAITKLIIEDSVTSIGNYAFYYCKGITSVTIPSNVTNIGNSAFNQCYNLTSVIIPNSVINIGDYAFSACHNLTSLIIPSSVTSIRNSTFYACGRLTSVTIPNSVTSIEKNAFSACKSLTSITIPNSVTSIGGSAFQSVPNVMYNGSATGSPWGAKSVNGYVDGWLVYEDSSKTNLLVCSQAATGSIVLPNSITSIGEEIFRGCDSLTSIEIPNSVTSIGKYAFDGCNGLTSIEIPNSVTRIGDNAFYKCNGLTSVTIGNGVTRIGAYAFEYCTNLQNIVIPNSVTSIETETFYECTSLTSVTIPNSVTNIGGLAFYRCYNLGTIYNYATTPQTVSSAEGGAFGSVPKSSCILYVPEESIDAYKAADVWKDFKNILALHASEGIEEIKPSTLQGESHKFIHNGQVLIQQGEKVYTVEGQKIK